MRLGTLSWISLTLMLGANGLAAQSIVDSTMSALARDSVDMAISDTISVGIPTFDTTSVDNIAQPAAAAPQPAKVVEVAPAVDTVVARACTSTPPGAAAPGLIGVVFRAQASESDRVAAARKVGGTLARAGDGGEEYIQLPDDGSRSRVAASRLIRLSSVSGVSEIFCPG